MKLTELPTTNVPAGLRVFPIARSDPGVTVIFAVAVLSAGTASGGAPPVTDAAAVTVDPDAALICPGIANVTVPLSATGPGIRHDIVPPDKLQPNGNTPGINPTGTGNCTVLLVAVSGPLFRAVKLMVWVLPAAADAGALTVRLKFAPDVTDVVSLSILLPGSGSPLTAGTLTPKVIEPLWVVSNDTPMEITSSGAKAGKLQVTDANPLTGKVGAHPVAAPVTDVKIPVAGTIRVNVVAGAGSRSLFVTVITYCTTPAAGIGSKPASDVFTTQSCACAAPANSSVIAKTANRREAITNARRVRRTKPNIATITPRRNKSHWL